MLTEEMISENEKIILPKSLNCIVGNIVEDREYGEEHEIRHGAKHFRPGAKVYVRPVTMGQPFDSWKATGKPKGRFRYITVAINSKLITNLRTTVVYSPSLINKLYKDFVYWESNEEAQSFLDGFRKYCPERAKSIKSS